MRFTTICTMALAVITLAGCGSEEKPTATVSTPVVGGTATPTDASGLKVGDKVNGATVVDKVPDVIPEGGIIMTQTKPDPNAYVTPGLAGGGR